MNIGSRLSDLHLDQLAAMELLDASKGADMMFGCLGAGAALWAKGGSCG